MEVKLTVEWVTGEQQTVKAKSKDVSTLLDVFFTGFEGKVVRIIIERSE